MSGRPKANLDWESIDNFLIAGCSGAEIAGYLGVNKHTLYDRCESDKGIPFSEYSQQKKRKGDTILRAKQFQEACDGNDRMMIWLGKNRLGQKDKQEVEQTIVDKKVIQAPETIDLDEE